MADGSDLIDFVSRMGGERQLRVEESLGSGYVRLRVSEAERRQAKHDIRCVEDAVVELLRNARDAGAAHIIIATSREGDIRTTTILDDGVGIPSQLHGLVFDARVTSKLDTMHMDRWGVHGRGMALFSIRENAVSARVTSSGTGLGTAIQIVTDATALSERTDQSTWPTIERDDDGRLSVARGPHNIARACCEFALEEHGTCEVYLGSPSEIVATIRRRIRPSVDTHVLLFVDDMTTLPVLERLSVASDASELMAVASDLGLQMSERTAYRIISGQIRPTRSVYSKLAHEGSPKPQGEVDIYAERRGLRISRHDAEEFSRIMEREFSYIADRYYVQLSGEPRIRVSKGKLTVTFDIEHGE